MRGRRRTAAWSPSIRIATASAASISPTPAAATCGASAATASPRCRAGRRTAARSRYVRAEPDNPNVWNLWALDLDSGESRRLTSNASGRPQGASWFPDSRRDRLRAGQPSSWCSTWYRARRPSTRPRRPGRKPGAPAVSPDGRLIIFPLCRRRRVAHRSLRRLVAQGAVRSDRRRLHVVARRDARGVLQPPGREWGVWIAMTR